MNNSRPHLKKRIPEFAFRAMVREARRLSFFDGVIAGNFIPSESDTILHVVGIDDSLAFIQVSPNGRHLWHQEGGTLIKTLIHPDTRARVSEKVRQELAEHSPAILKHLDSISV